MNAEEKSRYFEEVARNLWRGGFEAEAVSGDGLLPVRWQDRPLCQVTAEGGVRYRPDDVQRVAGNDAVERVTDIAKTTAQYMKLLEAAPPLKAKGLEGDYRLLAEFNDTVLAGQPTRYSVLFITWERDFAKTGLCWGHHHGEDYEKAKLDFASRSGLVAEGRLFPAEQLAEVYRTIHETLDGEYPLTAERESLLKGVGEQIERSVPDLQERISLSGTGGRDAVWADHVKAAMWGRDLGIPVLSCAMAECQT